MSKRHQIFQPNLGGKHDLRLKIPLDLHAPRGTFFCLGDTGRYLVCDDPTFRFAVVIKHPDISPFTRIMLGELPLAEGYWCGVGEFHLGDPLWEDHDDDEGETSQGEDDFAPGTLQVGEGFLNLRVRTLRGGTCWATIAQGAGGEPHTLYEDWSLFLTAKGSFANGPAVTPG